MARRASRTGFTIVELLIVVVVIAILAAITIVAYNGITNRAKNSVASSAAESAAKKVMTFAVTNSDSYPATLADSGVTDGNGTTYQYRVDNAANPKTFCVTATANSVSYFVSSTSAAPAAGACAGHGANGATTITNLATNPSAEVNGTGYTTYGGASLAQSAAWASSGSSSFRLTTNSTTNQGDFRFTGGGLTSFPLGLQAGRTYTISARVNIPVTFTGGFNRGPGILYWYSVNGSTYTESFGPKVSQTAGTYTTSYTIAIPSGATGIELGFGGASSTTGQIVYYDSIMVTEGATAPTYADGGSSGWAWNGATGLSTSSGTPL